MAETLMVQLAGFVFSVTDLSTGLPIEGAHCILYAAINNEGDAVGAYTDSQGVASLDVEWFVPRSWRVTKEGYVSQWSNTVVYETIVALEPTEIIYTVNVLAGVGGYTVPSGFLDVTPNTELLVTAYPDTGYILDYWVYKGQNVGSENPLIFLIDRDEITITAVFKVSEDTLIENYRGIDIMQDAVSANLYFRYEGMRYEFSYNTSIEIVRARIDELLDAPTPPAEWPVTRALHLFDNVKLKAEWYETSKAISRRIANIDTAVLLGGKLDYTVTYTQGLPIAETAKIDVEGMNIVTESLSKGQSKSGSIDLTGLIGKEVTITISFPSAPGIWSEVMFDIWITLGYSEEPSIEPKPDILPDWQKWLIWGAVGIGALLVLTRGPKVIVVKG